MEGSPSRPLQARHPEDLFLAAPRPPPPRLRVGAPRPHRTRRDQAPVRRLEPHPGNANNALKLLRQILNFAVARGHLDANPAREIRPNRRPRMTRFLSGEEIARLRRALDDCSGEWSATPADAAPGPVESIPVATATLTEVLDWHAEAHPDRIHAWIRERENHIETVIYARLREMALDVSGGILDAGVAPGARMALMMPTCAGFLHAFFGILYAGCMPVPIYPPARPSQLADHLRRQSAILANAGAELLVTVPEAQVLAAFLRSKVTSLRAVETVDGRRGRGSPEAAPAPEAGDIAFTSVHAGRQVR